MLKQQTLAGEARKRKGKGTRRERFLAEMDAAASDIRLPRPGYGVLCRASLGRRQSRMREEGRRVEFLCRKAPTIMPRARIEAPVIHSWTRLPARSS